MKDTQGMPCCKRGIHLILSHIQKSAIMEKRRSISSVELMMQSYRGKHLIKHRIYAQSEKMHKGHCIVKYHTLYGVLAALVLELSKSMRGGIGSAASTTKKKAAPLCQFQRSRWSKRFAACTSNLSAIRQKFLLSLSLISALPETAVCSGGRTLWS